MGEVQAVLTDAAATRLRDRAGAIHRAGPEADIQAGINLGSP